MAERLTLTEEEVAEALGMDVEDVERERRRGRLRGRKRRGKPVLYHPEALQDYLDQWAAETRTSNRNLDGRTGISPGAKAAGSDAVQRTRAIVKQLRGRSGSSLSTEPASQTEAPSAEILPLTPLQRL